MVLRCPLILSALIAVKPVLVRYTILPLIQLGLLLVYYPSVGHVVCLWLLATATMCINIALAATNKLDRLTLSSVIDQVGNVL